MTLWLPLYEAEITPLRREWHRIVLAVHEGRITELSMLCPDFQSALAAADRQVLLGAPDPLVRANVAAALNLLKVAANKCHRKRFFALSLQLYKSGYLLDVIDKRLQRYR
jgi:hypothetical protein